MIEPLSDKVMISLVFLWIAGATGANGRATTRTRRVAPGPETRP